MVTQIRTVLERYRQAAGDVHIELFEGSGHFPPIDAAERWSALFFEFIESAA
jgi:pimeloyl-ACP methyl ester carboxylesterase